MSYQKLVRDKIPQLIIDGGATPQYRIMNDFEYMIELDIKLEEEVKEYDEAEGFQDKLLELADIVEVAYAIAKMYGKSEEELNLIRAKKVEERGKFDDKIYLDGVW
jgi:predicted house-cleaning noncanonical NTP pyrophosphatase (MazG superfamily)